MSVLIRGMEMPKSCSDCLYEYETLKGETKCAICNGSIPNDESFSKRIPSCPMVEVPPHGRLIDADAIPWENQTMTYDDEWAIKAYDLEQMPTVIEADRPDEVTDVGCKVCNTNCYEVGTDGEMCSAWTKKPTVEVEEGT